MGVSTTEHAVKMHFFGGKVWPGRRRIRCDFTTVCGAGSIIKAKNKNKKKEEEDVHLRPPLSRVGVCLSRGIEGAFKERWGGGLQQR